MAAFVPVIICGGSGSRLWPYSRRQLPKPFAELPGRRQPLIDDTYTRVLGAPLPEPTAVITVTAADYAFLCQERYRAVGGGAPHLVIAEPLARNTAPAIAVAAELARRRFGDDTLVAVLPADHAIDDGAVYRRVLAQALAAAGEGYMALLGMRPTYPATGFGYIECGDALADEVHAVRRFVEKPDLQRARQFVNDDRFLWNGGTFCFNVRQGLAQLAAHAPDIHAALPAVFADDNGEGNMMPAAAAYEVFPSISFDYAVMEKTERAAVVRAADFKWSDIGSWRALADRVVADDNGNRRIGDVYLQASENCYVAAGGGRLVAGLGLTDIYIIDTPDALLVAPAEQTENVRSVFEALKQRQETDLPATVRRPWGSYTVLDEGEGYKVKRIEVLPHQKLSLQSHRQRCEHWTCVSGQMGIVIEARDFTLAVDESCYIAREARHRMYNDTDEPAAVIEVQIGSYLGEDDIIRYEDIYGRV